MKSFVESTVDLLAGIPSVVFGFIGMLVLVPSIQYIFDLPDGSSLLAAILVLSIMILPSIIKVSIGAIQSVPYEYELGSLALGANRVETVYKVLVPAARRGISIAVVLGVGRAIGEAMAVMMVAGNVANMPGIFESVRFLTTAVASHKALGPDLLGLERFKIDVVSRLGLLDRHVKRARVRARIAHERVEAEPAAENDEYRQREKMS